MSTKVSFTDLQSQYQEAKSDIDSAIQEILNTNSFITGPVVDEFEQKLMDYTGAEACASCGSGTTALQIALKACNIGHGDEVITVAHTFVSTTESIVNVGGTPVFCDIDDYYQMDIEQIENLITDKTKAILWVDLYGQSPDIDRIKQIASKHELYTIEDSAQSFGYVYKDKMLGTHADITCFSFNPVKNLGAIGDAGCVMGKTDLVNSARMFRDHGRREKFTYETVGYNCRIDNIQARVVQAKLPYLKSWLDRKHKIAEYYTTGLQQYYKTPQESTWGKHTYYVYVLQHEHRDRIRDALQERGIQTNIHYPNPTHMTPAFRPWAKTLNTTEKISSKIFSIPCYHSLTDNQVEYVVDTLKEFK